MDVRTTNPWSLSRRPCQSLQCLEKPDEQIAAETSALRVTSSQLQRLILVRQLRSSLIGRGLFADPAWDMLLALYAAELDDKRLSETELCSVVDVPLSTAERWIDALEERKLVVRGQAYAKGRIRLSPAGNAALNRYFSTVANAVLPF